MRINLNGKPKEIASGQTIEQFMLSHKLHRKATVIEYNQEILAPETWKNIKIKSHDQLEIISFVGGG